MKRSHQLADHAEDFREIIRAIDKAQAEGKVFKTNKFNNYFYKVQLMDLAYQLNKIAGVTRNNIGYIDHRTGLCNMG